MKSLKFCLALIAVFGFSFIYGQAGDPAPGVSISKFENGKKLSQDDVNFLGLITTKNADLKANYTKLVSDINLLIQLISQIKKNNPDE